jgi:hypothetical protein
MKRYLLSAIAIVAAISMTAFTTTGNKTVKSKVSLHWFKISGTLDPSAEVPRANTIEYLGFSENPPTPLCDGDGYQCVSGFADTQVSNEELIDDSQVPEMVADEKSN